MAGADAARRGAQTSQFRPDFGRFSDIRATFAGLCEVRGRGGGMPGVRRIQQADRREREGRQWLVEREVRLKIDGETDAAARRIVDDDLGGDERAEDPERATREDRKSVVRERV